MIVLVRFTETCVKTISRSLLSCDRLSIRTGEMLLPIGQGRSVVGVSIAVMAKVRAGVVLADVLGHDAAAGGTLAFVLAIIAGLPTVWNAEKRIASVHENRLPS